MRNIFVLVSLAFVFISCSLHEPKPIKASQKAFAEEDLYILYALRAEEVKEYGAASELFTKLYTKSHKREYLYRSLENDLVAKKDEQLIKRVDALQKDQPFDAKLLRYKVIALFELNRLDEAKKLGVLLSTQTKETNDYLLVSDIYIKRKEYDLAVKYLESAYVKENDEKILDKLSIILYVNLNRKKEAIAHLETHSRMLGCSQRICSRLIAFYANDNNIEGLLSTYLRLYEVNKSEKITKKIIQIYAYKQDYPALTKFLEKSGADDEVLLQLYTSAKNYAKAYPLANTLYKETAKIDFLGQSAIYEYEGAKDKSSKILLQSVIKKLEKVVQENNQDIYLNYLGYILIDHEIDVKKGMLYVDKVLESQPHSAFYLDSKAWGYYKLGQCKKADKLITKVSKMQGGDNPEIILHIQKIDSCLKNKKGKK